VCSVASELLKHCLGLDQFKGGRIVAESVSSYMRQRAKLYLKRQKVTNRIKRRLQEISKDILLCHENYDEINEDSGSDDEGIPQNLSDDEGIESNPGLISHLQKGILPPELQVLYALCLIGEGGKNYLVFKLIQSLQHLKDDMYQDIEQEIIDPEAKSNSSWLVYRRAMTDELGKIPALAFVTDLLRKVGREADWANQVAPYFRTTVDSMEVFGFLEQSLSKETPRSHHAVLISTQVVKIVLADARFRNLQCEVISRNMSCAIDAHAFFSTHFDHCLTVLTRIWKVENGIPSKSGVEALQIITRAIRLFETTESDPVSHARRLQKLIAVLTNIGFDSEETEEKDSGTLPLWKDFPLSSSWQSESLRLLSTFVHNLCASCCVTLFSGWEKAEFNLNLLRRSVRKSYFGITLHDSRVIGYLNCSIKDKLADIWSIVTKVTNLKTDFSVLISEGSAFLEQESVSSPTKADNVTKYAENDALSIIIAYAKQCIVASRGRVTKLKTELFQIGMSLLLPMSQFCVVEKIWETKIGVATVMVCGVDEWLSSKLPFEGATGTYKPPPRNRNKQRQLAKLLKDHFWHKAEVKSMPQYVPVPLEHLNSLWVSDQKESSSQDSQGEVKEFQHKVDGHLRKLRLCPSENSLQKASLPVTLALIDLIPHAQNPFLVMQHAVMFASQCAKGGQMDLHFKTELPRSADCTPLQALQILIRADSLAAVHFTQEATFLCCHVVRICQARRRKDEDWTIRWKVVGICTYNTSLSIRNAIFSSFLTKEEISKGLEGWKEKILVELDLCRLDAIDMHEPSAKLHAELLYDEEDDCTDDENEDDYMRDTVEEKNDILEEEADQEYEVVEEDYARSETGWYDDAGGEEIVSNKFDEVNQNGTTDEIVESVDEIVAV